MKALDHTASPRRFGTLPPARDRSGFTRRSILVCAALTVLCMLGAKCDFVDPSATENPKTTDDDLATSSEPTRAILPGLRRHFASALSALVLTTEYVSDNVAAAGIFGIDFPREVSSTSQYIGGTTEGVAIYWNLQELRGLSDFVLEDIAPSDEQAGDLELAEAHYYRGMAYLMLGENFVAVPTKENETPSKAGDLIGRAIADLTDARRLGFGVQAIAALARAERALGNESVAAQHAEQALAAGGIDFVSLQRFDLNSVRNEVAFELAVQLQTMQPLPRLDFLDPKYFDLEQGIPVAKAEEMLLILAENALGTGNLDEARARMIEAVAVAGDRPRVRFQDDDTREDAFIGQIRPDTAAINVRPDATSPFKGGLVLNRPGPIDTPTVSGTSVSASEVASSTAPDSLTRLLYLLRQEILFLEGRRMHDLGVRLPMMQREIDTNPNIAEGDLGTRVFVPDYIPPSNEMDQYSPIQIYDVAGDLITTNVTIHHDMNSILAQRRGLVMQNPMLP